MYKMKWKKIPSYPDYDVSEYGDVRLRVDRCNQYKKGTILKGGIDKYSKGGCGTHYRYYRLSNNKTQKFEKAHRLVAFAFIGQPPFKDAVISHKDGVRSNNHYSNLEWVTRAENARVTASMNRLAGENSPNAKLTEKQVLEIRQLHTGERGQSVRLSNKYGVTPDHIRKIVNRKKWGHI